MNKILRKLRFTLRIASLGADWRSRLTLLKEAVRIQKNFYTRSKVVSYRARVGTPSRNALMHFRGTLDELHALTEIFIERCYDPHDADIETILDLGANIGLASVWFWIEFPGCRIDAYEPDPATFSVLKKNLEPLPLVRVFNAAITPEGGSLEFHSAERSFSSSIYPVPSSTSIRVQGATLDQAIHDMGGSADLVKMDIEGAEFDVVANSKSLSNIRFIIGEIHPEKAQRSSEELLQILERDHRIIKKAEENKSLFYAVKK